MVEEIGAFLQLFVVYVLKILYLPQLDPGHPANNLLLN
jgi:hypothetical protein